MPPYTTPAYMRRCVASLVEDGYDTNAAFAICNSTMQKAGYLTSGSGQRETAKGKKRKRQLAAQKVTKKRDVMYERALKMARRNPDFYGTSVSEQRARLEEELQTYRGLAADANYDGEEGLYEYALKNQRRIQKKLRKLKGQERRPRKNPALKAPGISDADVRKMGEAYLKGKDISGTRKGKEMARAAAESVHRQFAALEKKIDVIFTERDPYPDFEALAADVKNNKRMYIYTGDSVTPLWNERTNWMARAVHDYDHVKEGAGFGLHGELMAYRTAARKAPQLADLYMSEIPLQAAAFHVHGSFPEGAQKVVSVNEELKRLVNKLGMRQNPPKRRSKNRMRSLAEDAQTLGKFMKKEDIALHLGAKYKNKAAVEEGVLAAISGIGRKKR